MILKKGFYVYDNYNKQQNTQNNRMQQMYTQLKTYN